MLNLFGDLITKTIRILFKLISFALQIIFLIIVGFLTFSYLLDVSLSFYFAKDQKLLSIVISYIF